jgi:hypothetical protein
MAKNRSYSCKGVNMPMHLKPLQKILKRKFLNFQQLALIRQCSMQPI